MGGETLDIQRAFGRFKDEERRLEWEGTFAEYLEIVAQNPSVADLSHARIYRMLSEGRQGDRCTFFDGEIFGLEGAIRELDRYFASAARRLEVRKRILLLMGPVGGGKSTIVTLLKRGLERFTRTEAGAVYAIADCPMHEEPLHLVPQELREAVGRELGVHIEGELCPVCRLNLRERYRGDEMSVPVRRILFSERDRIGIGTFSPSDPKSQDIAELTGSIDLSTIGTYGSESDPRAYRFDGELNVANRGLMEFIEMLKADERFLYVLLSLSQEQSIKTGRFSLIYADEAVISHTNEAEFRAFVDNPKNEALKDRIILIKVPYNLRLRDEVRIYQKLIGESALAGVHLAPHTLEVAAMLAVLSRLKESKRQGMSLIRKMRLYDGQEIEGMGDREVAELREEFPDEGMDGLSPRFVINRLSQALVDRTEPCLFPIDALKALKEGLATHTSISPAQRERLENLIYEVRKEYDEIAKTEVNRAFVYSFETSAKVLFDHYIENVEAYLNHDKLKDPITGEPVDPDEALMRSIEEQIGVTENAKKSFREEILLRISALARRGQPFNYRSHERLREAVEKRLFSDLKNVVKITTSASVLDPAQKARVDEVALRLQTEEGYCPSCARELLRYVGTLLAR
jgi:serine protein kinase